MRLERNLKEFNEEIKKDNDQEEDFKNGIEQDKITLQQAQSMYNQIKHENITFDENFQYEIWMNDEDDLRILDYTCEVKFPKIKELKINQTPAKIDIRLEKLLNYSFLDSLEQLYIDWGDRSSRISSYIDSLTAIISKTTNKVTFNYP